MSLYSTILGFMRIYNLNLVRIRRVAAESRRTMRTQKGRHPTAAPPALQQWPDQSIFRSARAGWRVQLQ